MKYEHRMTPDDWRTQPGYLCEGYSNFESVHILFGRFLADRHSENPLPERSLLKENPAFEWGAARPLEKVIRSWQDFEFLMKNPQIVRNSITIIEPWEHVGVNPQGEDVRASLNVAYVAQKVADCDSILFPAWLTGVLDPNIAAALFSSGLAVVVEGGDPSVRDPNTFTHPNCSMEDFCTLVEKLLLLRTPTSAPALFICLGHQLAAQCHIRLIKSAVKQVLELPELERDRNNRALKALKQVCQRIVEVGSTLKVVKGDGHIVAEGWDHPEFAVGRNEWKEVGDRTLLHYESPENEDCHIPLELLTAHDVTADEFEGVIDTAIEYEREVTIAMFHSDEVNQEAMLFANWAYRLLHEAIIPHRHILAGSSLAWMMQMPYAVEILCSTAADGEIVTECSATCILYKDFETRKTRRSFTCQFHPELLSDLRTVGLREAPSYSDMKHDDGIRLLVRLLYDGMQE